MQYSALIDLNLKWKFHCMTCLNGDFIGDMKPAYPHFTTSEIGRDANLATLSRCECEPGHPHLLGI